MDTIVMIIHSMGLNHRYVSKLGSSRHELVSRPFHLPNEKLITDNFTFKNEVFLLQALLNNELICVDDGSFYPDISHLISAAWFASMNGELIAFRYFISSVPIEFSYPFVAEMCGILDIVIIVDHILFKCPNSSTSIKIIVGSDFQPAINDL